MRFAKIVRMFRRANVIVTGKIGRGKDMLISNVVARRNEPYVSNVPYGGKHIPLDLNVLDAGQNTYRNFISGDIKYYEAPYADGTDIYISDVGIYLPAQYCTDLNKQYPYLPTFLALVRQIQAAHVHINTQALNRAWDKLREQADQFITCRRCIVLFGGRLVLQWITIYDRAESCANEVPQFPRKLFKGFGTRREIYMTQERTYLIEHGHVDNKFLVYRNRGDYDTRYFKTLLAGGRKEKI